MPADHNGRQVGCLVSCQNCRNDFIEDQSLEMMPGEGSREFGYESWAFCPPDLKAEQKID
jgi:hypothetical protein